MEIIRPHRALCDLFYQKIKPRIRVAIFWHSNKAKLTHFPIESRIKTTRISFYKWNFFIYISAINWKVWTSMFGLNFHSLMLFTMCYHCWKWIFHLLNFLHCVWAENSKRKNKTLIEIKCLQIRAFPFVSIENRINIFFQFRSIAPRCCNREIRIAQFLNVKFERKKKPFAILVFSFVHIKLNYSNSHRRIFGCNPK